MSSRKTPRLRVAVTGATGFVGAHSVKALRDAGHVLRLLVHPDEVPENTLGRIGVELSDVEVVRGDVREAAVVDRLLDGCDAVLHTAGIVGVDDRREPLMWQVNVQATAGVLSRAVALRLDPIVHVSSYSALFPSPDPVIGPDSPVADGRSAYGRTKAAADRIARGLQAGGAPVVITYPSTIVGPPAGERRGVGADGWAPLLRYGASVSFEGGMAMIDVRDVAAVHAAVMQPGRGPRRYMCGGQMVRFDDALDVIEATAGRRIRRIRVSPRTFRAAGRVADVLNRMLPFPPSLSYEAAWVLTAATPTDDSATLADLDLTWRPARQALADSLPQAPR